jgi:hypothetical protein
MIMSVGLSKITDQMIEEAASRLRGTGHWEGDLTRQQRNQVRSVDVVDVESRRSFRILWAPTRGKLGNMVEVWDLTYAGQQFGRDGQFVSAYHVDTFLADEGSGLVLDGGVPVWRICGQTMTYVRAWVKTMEEGR